MQSMIKREGLKIKMPEQIPSVYGTKLLLIGKVFERTIGIIDLVIDSVNQVVVLMPKQSDKNNFVRLILYDLRHINRLDGSES